MSSNDQTIDRKGYLFAMGAFGIWGLVPIFWKTLSHIPSSILILERVLWAAPFFALVLSWKKSWAALRPIWKSPRLLLGLGLSSTLIAINWSLYVWAVNANHIVEASLGYFINPLFNIALGALFFGERWSPIQKLGVLLTSISVAYLTIQTQSIWISLSLAGTFGLYAVVRKKLPLKALEASAFESFVVAGIAALSLLFWSPPWPDQEMNWSTQLLIVLSGPLTAIPLVWFNEAARRIPLSHLGFFQYTSPTLQFLIGVFVFHEAFDAQRLMAYSLIWLAVLFVAFEAYQKERAFTRT